MDGEPARKGPALTAPQLDFITASETPDTHQKTAEAERLKEVAGAQAAREAALVEGEKALLRQAEQTWRNHV